MTKEKAKKVLTIPGKYCSIVEYEYRGKHYYVEYANSWTYCVTPASIQHMNEQDRIDAEIEMESKKRDDKPVDWDAWTIFVEAIEE